LYGNDRTRADAFDLENAPAKVVMLDPRRIRFPEPLKRGQAEERETNGNSFAPQNVKLGTPRAG
jgi:hypothetical protein